MDTQKIIAFIPSAGLGTRLKEETQDLPKALVSIHNKPMIYWIFKKVISCGVSNFIVNVHHESEKLIAWLTAYQNANPGIRIHLSLEKEQLLDTGGALKHALHILENYSHVLVHNVDIFTDLNILHYIQNFKTRSADAILLVSDRKTNRYLLFDKTMRLCGWENRNTNEQLITRGKPENLKNLAFSGIYIFDTKLLDFCPDEDVFSVIPWFLHLSQDHNISGIQHDVSHWYDAGKPPSLKVLREMSEMQFKQLTEI
jgi:N-acetyl-alpha-D-muramate 1-phosphate uridylyltransferase